MSFVVTMSSAVGRTVTVRFDTQNNTAVAGSDFVGASNGTLTFLSGETQKTIAVLVNGDQTLEPNENFFLNLSNPINATVGTPSVTGTITDDEARASINPTVTVIGDSGGTSAVFTISLNRTSPVPITVNYSTANGPGLFPATANVDYQAISSSVVFGIGETTKLVTVPVLADTLDEEDETFSVNISGAANLILAGQSQGVATIVDGEDVPPMISITDTSVSEGDSTVVNAMFTVSLSNASGKPITVNFATQNGVIVPFAQAGADYNSTTGVLTFNPGQTVRVITVGVLGDLVGEPNETFNLNLTSPTNATFPGMAAMLQATGTIIDNEPRVSIADRTVVEGNGVGVNADFLVTLSKASDSNVPISIVYQTTSGTAIGGVDFTATTATLVFSPGETVKSILVPITGDLLNEDDETFFIDFIGPATNALIADGQATGTIIDNDALPSLAVDDNLSIVEGNGPGPTMAVFNVRLSAPSGRQVTVNYATADQSPLTAASAVSGSDYNATAGLLTFAPGVTLQTISVPIVGETALAEPDESFLINLSTPNNATLGDPQAIGTIIDDEVRIAIAGPAGPVSEGTNAAFTVTLLGTPTANVTVVFATMDGTATLLQGDYTNTNGSLTFTFSATETSKTILVPVLGDLLDENAETFSVMLSSPSANARIEPGLGTATATILDIDSPPVVTISNALASVTETNSGTVNAVFTVSLSAASGLPITVPFATADGTATVAGQDYNSTGGVLTFAPGDVTKNITVQVRGDVLGEPNETFLVNLSTPTNATLPGASPLSSIGTIVDDEPRVAITDIMVNEGMGNATFTVTMTTGASADVVVAFATAAGSATAGTDYTPTSGNLTFTFLAGETVKLINVPVINDLLDENSETFIVNLTSVSTNHVISTGQATATILDNDDPPTVSIGNVTVTEGNAGLVNAVFQVTLSGASGLTVTVPFSTADVSAMAPGDYNSASGVLTFNAGEVVKTVTVQVKGDQVAENNETFVVNLGVPTNATLNIGTGTGTITDDEPRVSISDTTVTEGSGGSVNATFAVTLDRPAVNPTVITISYSTADGTATVGADYTGFTSSTLIFNPGETVKSLLVPVVGDLLNEDNETFVVNLVGAVNAIILDGQGVGTIVDNDPLPALQVIDQSVVESNGGTNLVFRVTLTPSSGRTVSVAYQTQDNGSALAGVDYTFANGILNFAAGESEKFITVPITGDIVGEPNETFLVNLFSPTNATISDNQAVGTIIDDEPRIVISGVTVNEDTDTNAVFLVTLVGTPSGNVSFTFTTADGTATAGADYTSAGGALTFNAGLGEMTKLISVALLGDTLDEINETFVINLTGSSGNAVIQTAQATATIVDNDGPPTISLFNQTVTEGNSGTVDAVFEVRLSAASGLESRVNFATANGTATVANSDYNAASGVVTFAPGSTQQFITVQVRGDTVGEANENFLVNLSTPVNASFSGPPPQGVGTILDDEPRVTINDVSVLENDSTLNAIFNIDLDRAPSGDVTVVFTTASNTALAGQDFSTTAGTVVFAFATSETRKQVTVPIAGDLLDEFDETYFINLTGVSPNAVLVDTQGVGTIGDNDLPPTVSVGNVTVTEGNTGAANAVFQVTLSGASGLPINVPFSTADGTGTSPADYSAAGGVLLFNPGEVTKTVTVQVVGERVPENNETFVVNLGAPTNATPGVSQGTGTILDDEPLVSIAGTTVLETNGDTSATFVVSLDRISAVNVLVAYSTLDGTAVSPADYTGVTGGTVTFLPGQVTANLVVTVKGDLLNEANETFTVNLLSTNMGGVPVVASGNARVAVGSAQGRIDNDDALPTLSVGGALSVTEGNAATVDMLFPVTLSSASGQTVTVTYTTEDGTAQVGGGDYDFQTNVLTFLPGETGKTVTVKVRGDVLGEPNETLAVRLSAPANAMLATAVNSGTIVDDEPRINIGNASLVEGDGGTLNMLFDVTLSSTSGTTVTAGYTTANNTAVAGLDYVLASGTVMFLPGQLLQQITVQVLGDALDESNETFFVNLTPGSTNALIQNAQGVGTILDNDGSPSLSIAGASTFEGDSGLTSLVFTVTLSPASGQQVTANFTTVGGSATVGTDFLNASGPITFAPGATTQQITVQVLGDATPELDETFNVSLSGAVNATIAVANGVGTILDDDPRLSIDDVTVGESSGQAVFSVVLSEMSGVPVTVSFATASVSATQGVDYAGTSGVLTFAVGTTVRQITVPILNDLLDESDETFVVTLSGAVNSVLLDGQGVGTILDDDALPQISIGNVSVTEGNGGATNAVFTVSLTPVSGQDVTVQFATAPGTATAGVDYQPTSGVLTFLAASGQTQRTITVQVVGDLTVEPDETFFVNLTGATNASVVVNSATGTILDNEPKLSINDASVIEGNLGTTSLVFTATLSTASTVPVSFRFDAVDNTTTAGSDYAPASGTLTFGIGVTSLPITVTVTNDLLAEIDETFFVNLSNVSGANLLDGQGVGTIRDNDPGVTIADASLTEGDFGSQNLVFSVTLSQASSVAATVNFATANGSATAGSDYTAASGVVSFAAGETSKTITVVVQGDTLSEINETFTVNLSNPVNTVIQTGAATGTILDTDPLPSMSIQAVNTVTEGNSPVNAVFTVSLSAASGRDVTVAFATAENTANSADFTATSGMLTFSPGQVQRTITVQITGDALVENDENFALNLNGAMGATLTLSSSQATIVDDDTLVSINNVNSVETDAPGVNAVFNVTLSKAVGALVVVGFTTASGTATAGVDFTATSGNLTFAAGTTSLPVTVAIAGDTLDEANETFTVNLTILSGGGQPGNLIGTATITDNDPAPQISINDISVAEGNTGTRAAVFTVTMTPASGQAVSVQFATSGQTATAGNDYQTASGTVSFAPGQTTQQVTVLVNGDPTSELDETFLVTLSAPLNATLNDFEGVGTIRNDDAQHLMVVAADAGGGPHVRVFNTFTGVEQFSFLAYSAGFTGGVRVASGDVNGDGQPDIITAPGRGGGPHVRVFDGRTGVQLPGLIGSFLAFEGTFAKGLQVAAGDVNGDGRADIIVGTDGDPGDAQARVRIFDGLTGGQIRETTLGAGSGLTSGVRVAAGDLNGDGRADVIVGSAPGVASRVRVFNGADGSTAGLPDLQPYGGFAGGVYVAAGDFNGDGRVDIFTGAGAGGGPHVQVFNGVNTNLAPLASFLAYGSFGGGVRVGSTDFNGDGFADIITGAGPGGGPHVRVLSGPGLTELSSFLAFGGFTGGVNVGGSFKTTGAPLFAAGGAVASSGQEALTNDQVQPLLRQAVADWAAAGLSKQLLARLSEIEVRVADLPGDFLGMAFENAIVLDRDAAGHGWFIDGTPDLDEEYGLLAAGGLLARQDSAAARGMDLLTVIAHELGHTLGLEDSHGPLGAALEHAGGELMSDELSPGIRRSPTSADVDELFSSGDWR